MKHKELLIATLNFDKFLELSELFSNLPFKLFSLQDFSVSQEVAETGTTFRENAELKASEYARQTGLLALADDSGLEVAALGGAPGIFSARYAGKAASDAQKIEKLLSELEKTGDRERKAQFVCSIALAGADGQIIRCETGVCPGVIAVKPRGDKGFGYDPIFVPNGFNETFGELSQEIKQQISHRARASQQIRRFLHDFCKFSLDQADFTD